MMNYSYYPFKNNLNDINHEDLLLLKDISEGWYIDYKSNGLKISDFAKHLSAFANQYGGWLLIGIEENSNGTRTAEKFTGIANSEVEKVCRDIREASSAHINPEVYYEEKIVRGPIEEIGLDEGRSILIIGIPMSLNTPHIHSSGRIYKRVADQSKPKEEVDRYQLDKLWERSQNYKQKVSTFLTTMPKLSKAQEDSSWIHVFFKLSDFQFPSDKALEFSSFKSIVQTQGDKKMLCFAPLDSVSTTVDGYVGRQVQQNHPMYNTLSLRWYHEGAIRLDIPLNSYDIQGFCNQYKDNENALTFLSKLTENLNVEQYSNIRIIDYSKVATTLFSLSGTSLYLFKEIENRRDIFSCFTLRNVSHSLPFFDTSSFIDKIKSDGFPLTLDNIISVPLEPSEDNMDIVDVDFSNMNFMDESKTYTSITKMAAVNISRILFVVGALVDVNDDDKILEFFELKLSKCVKN